MKKPKDRHLDTFAKANRDKHVNFTARERGETDPSVDSERNERNKKKDGWPQQERPKK